MPAVSTLLLLSGGIDSTCIAAWKRPEICLTIDYGQRPAVAEIEAAREVCAALELRHETLICDLRHLGSGDLTASESLSIAPTPEWWPFRNQMLLTLAAMKGVGWGITTILIGTVSTDRIHADTSKEFINRADALFGMQEGHINIAAPGSLLTPAVLIKKSKIGISTLSLTHSCHTGNHACGFCRGCQKHQMVLSNLK